MDKQVKEEYDSNCATVDTVVVIRVDDGCVRFYYFAFACQLSLNAIETLRDIFTPFY